MVSWDLLSSENPQAVPIISAVSYLNTVPLVWGMLHGPEREFCRLDFCLPSQCADRVANGSADLGIVPVIEVQRQDLMVAPGAGIACRGPVRSILLVSKVRFSQIGTLAADAGSRSSVMLARILLRGSYAADPEIMVMPADLPAMLEAADAALLIGDAALRLDPDTLPYHVADLGQEWQMLTGLPMVFAVWAGKPERLRPWLKLGIESKLRDSLQYGLENMNTIVEQESRSRGFSPALVRRYLSEHIVFDIGEREQEGMRTFLKLAADLDAAPQLEPAPAEASRR